MVRTLMTLMTECCGIRLLKMISKSLSEKGMAILICTRISY